MRKKASLLGKDKVEEEHFQAHCKTNRLHFLVLQNITPFSFETNNIYLLSFLSRCLNVVYSVLSQKQHVRPELEDQKPNDNFPKL